MGRFCPVSDETGQVTGLVLFLYDHAPTLEYERMAMEEAVTERKRAEKILRESEEKYRSLVNQSSEALFLHDLDGRLMDVNGAALAQTGYTRAELLGMNVFDLHPDSTESARIRKQWRSWPKGGPPIRMQTSHRRKDGTVFPVEVSTSKVSYGGWDFMLALVMDVSERRETEERQKRLVRRLEGLWQLSRLADADEETFSNFVLTECLDITGSRYGFFGMVDEKESAMVSYSLSRDVREDCQTAVRPVRFSIPEAGVWAEAVRRREPLVMNDYTAPHPAKKGLPEGHVSLTRLLAVPFLTEGQVSFLVAVANKETDYTEEDLRELSSFMGNARLILDRRKTDSALRESEEKFRVLADATPVAILLYQDDRWIYANRAAESICGYTAGELLSMNFWDFVHPDHRTVIRDEGRKRQRGEETTQRHKFKIVAKDGVEKWVDLSGATPSSRPAGRPHFRHGHYGEQESPGGPEASEETSPLLDESPLGVASSPTTGKPSTPTGPFWRSSVATAWRRFARSRRGNATPRRATPLLERREKRRQARFLHDL
jgi:PAS domain S-box-containing protein